LENHSIYLFFNEVQLAKTMKVVQELRDENWVFVSSFVFLENNNLHHIYPILKVRMIKNGITKWIFINPNGNIKKLNEV
jgi:hypothetical protein